MRSPILICLVAAAIAACSDETPNPDSQTGNHPPPRVIPGGGIGDGAIDGVVNLYVIDDVTRKPVAGAKARVGTVDGTTDATGLFVANGVTGPQTVVVTAASYRSEMWIGANGANMTFDLQPQVAATPASAKLSGQITGFAALTVPAGHIKVATVTYAQSDDIGKPENSLATPNNTNTCFALQPTDPCNFTVVTRTGRIGLIAAIFDRDLKGTPNDPSDDTMKVIRWAIRSNVTVASGVDQTSQDLTMFDTTDLNTVSVDFGTPPAGLANIGAFVGIDGGADGIYQLLIPKTPIDSMVLVPKLSALVSTNYRVTAIAQNGTGANIPQSVVVRRALTDTTLPVGTWLPPPSGVTVTRTTASWSAVAGATVSGLELTQGTTTVTHLLNITVFDATTQVTLPDLVTLPSGTLDAHVSVIGADGLDVTNFALDTDRSKLDRVGMQPVTVN